MRIGVDLGGTKIEIAAFDASGGTLVRRRVPSPAHDYDAIVERIGALVEEVEAETARRGTVGLGTPGAPSVVSGLMKNANSTVLLGKPLGADVAARLKREVRIANDADCLTLSEAVDGAAAGAATVFGVIVGTGVGGGIAIGGRLVRGPNGITGEWGHNPLPWPRDGERPGPACYCGKFGCLETFVSGPGLARDFARAGGPAWDAARIVAAEAEGHPGATAAVARYVDRLARGLATVVNVLDPDAIVLGGGVSNAAILYERLPAAVGAYAFTDALQTRILRASHGDASGVRGAARLWPPS